MNLINIWPFLLLGAAIVILGIFVVFTTKVRKRGSQETEEVLTTLADAIMDTGESFSGDSSADSKEKKEVLDEIKEEKKEVLDEIKGEKKDLKEIEDKGGRKDMREDLKEEKKEALDGIKKEKKEVLDEIKEEKKEDKKEKKDEKKK